MRVFGRRRDLSGEAGEGGEEAGGVIDESAEDVEGDELE